MKQARRGLAALTGFADGSDGEAALRSRLLAAALVNSTAEALCAFDLELRILEWNPAMTRLTGLPRRDAVGRLAPALDITREWAAPRGTWQQALRGTATVLTDEPWGRRYGNHSTFVEGTVAPLVGPTGATVGGVMTLRDVSSRVAARHQLQQSEARFRSLFDQAAVGIVMLDADEVIRDANPAFVQFLGYDARELSGRPLAELLADSPSPHARSARTPVREIIAGRRRSVTVEKRFLRKDGEERWATFTVSSILVSESEFAVVGMAHDVTERKALETALAHQAYHDPLTGLGNRALFLQRVEQALARPTAERSPVAVIYCDLDDFKKVNDSLGHAAGDQLLCIIADRLRGATRAGDTVCRLGGDEFSILVELGGADASPEHDRALAVAERVLHSLAQPVALDGNEEAFVGGSVGVARAGTQDDAATLLRNADVAMYAAKNGGKGRVVEFAHELQSAALERLRLEASLRHAVERDELRLRYQPVVDLATGAIVGVEALLRWQHPERGLLPPSEFLELCEQTGLIHPVGCWVVEEACRQGARWAAALPPGTRGTGDDALPFTISVNVSARQLQKGGFEQQVAGALEATGFPPSQLLLEITESVFLEQEGGVLERLHALKALGVRLGIDDFGTGFSSLRYLQRFPLDVLKVDRCFVEGVARGGSDAALAKAIIALGEVLCLRTVAEGIEWPAQREQLQSLGCDMGQGYLFAPPLEADQVQGLLVDYATGAIPADRRHVGGGLPGPDVTG